MPARLPSPLLAACVILLVLACLWPRAAVTPLSSYDQRFYLGIAYDLRHADRFTDGFSYAGGNAATARPPGMRFAPLYPAMLAGLASVDPHLRVAIDCVEQTLGRDPACPRAAPSVRYVQFLMLVAVFWLIWAAIGRAAGSARASWMGLGIALLTAPSLLLFVNTLMTEIVSLLFSTAACTLAAFAATERTTARQWRWWLACGLALGLAILSRPAFLYLFWAGLPVGVWMVLSRPARGARIASLAGFCVGVAGVVAPWIVRNALVLHRAALSFGYASHTLVQRIAFDAMTPHEYALSFVCWLPDGSGLGKLLAGAHACDRFGWDEHPNSFYSIGTNPLMRQSVAAAGGWQNHMHYLLHHYLMVMPVKHLLVTIPLVLRGMYVDHYWGLMLAPLSLIAIWRAIRGRNAGVLLLSLPAWFLLGFNALVAVNQPRYNFLLILPFSLAGAMALEAHLPGLSRARRLTVQGERP